MNSYWGIKITITCVKDKHVRYSKGNKETKIREDERCRGKKNADPV